MLFSSHEAPAQPKHCARRLGENGDWFLLIVASLIERITNLTVVISAENSSRPQHFVI
jgi:hypothetical protein